jgi:molecular chaperone GrpE (heat shock protein)
MTEEAKKENDVVEQQPESEQENQEPANPSVEASNIDSNLEKKSEQSKVETINTQSNAATEEISEELKDSENVQELDTDSQNSPVESEAKIQRGNLDENEPNQEEKIERETEKDLENKLEKAEREIQRLKQENQELKSEKEQQNPKKRFYFQESIEKAVEEQNVQIKEDKRDYDRYYKQVQHWNKKVKILKEEIVSTVKDFEQKLEECRQIIKDKFSSELQEKLKSRHEALEIIGKMSERLLESNLFSEEDPEDSELPKVSEEEFQKICLGENDEQSFKKALDQKLKEVGNQRWQIVSQMRDLAQQRRKGWLQFVEKKMLPILDGLADGKKYSQLVVEELKKNESEYLEDLNNWLQTHEDWQTKLLDLLKRVGVYPINDECGKPIDYNRHEPIDVERDENFKDEDIKEIVRQGYEYEDETETGKERPILRPAQVVVVKNN